MKKSLFFSLLAFILAGCAAPDVIEFPDNTVTAYSTLEFLPIGKYACYDFADYIVAEKMQNISAKVETRFRDGKIDFIFFILDKGRIVQSSTRTVLVVKQGGKIDFMPKTVEFLSVPVEKYSVEDYSKNIAGNLRTPLLRLSLYTKMDKIWKNKKEEAQCEIWYSFDEGGCWKWQERENNKCKDLGVPLATPQMFDVFAGKVYVNIK